MALDPEVQRIREVYGKKKKGIKERRIQDEGRRFSENKLF
jgi:hypothetical protein